ncbi:MAG TPA: hypothetical protein V6C65_08270 [Allocoleopsis sp.]
MKNVKIWLLSTVLLFVAGLATAQSRWTVPAKVKIETVCLKDYQAPVVADYNSIWQKVVSSGPAIEKQSIPYNTNSNITVIPSAVFPGRYDIYDNQNRTAYCQLNPFGSYDIHNANGRLVGRWMPAGSGDSWRYYQLKN